MVLEIGESGIEGTCTCHADVVAVEQYFGQLHIALSWVARLQLVPCRMHLMY